MDLTTEQWQRVTGAAHGKVAALFKPRENLIILDFIQTASSDIPGIVNDINVREKK